MRQERFETRPGGRDSFTRRDLFRRFKPAVENQPISVVVDTPPEFTEKQDLADENSKHLIPRRKIIAVTAAVGAGLVLDKILPKTFTLPFPPATENQGIYRTIDNNLLSADDEIFIAHRSGNSSKTMGRAAAARFKGTDLDLSKVEGPKGGIFVGHEVQFAIPFLGLVFAGHDEASGRVRRGGGRRFEDVLEDARDLGITMASAELKRKDLFMDKVLSKILGGKHGGFTPQDIKYMHDTAARIGIRLVLHSPSYEDVIMAAQVTGNSEACYFRPEIKNNDSKLEAIKTACENSHALFTDFATVEQNRESLRRYSTPVVVSVKHRDEAEKLKSMKINITAFFNNAPDLQRGFGQEA